jgi:ribosomal protein S18 acetylase RimI-like enzyme
MKKLILTTALLYSMITIPHSITIVPAESIDALAIAQVHHDSWHTAYRGVHAPSLAAQLTSDWFKNYWQRYFQNVPADSFVLVAKQNNSIIGFVAGGKCTDKSPFSPGHDGELYKLYLTPQVQQQGLGTRLFQACIEALRSRGYYSMLIRAIKENIPSCKFYAKQGGCIQGEQICSLDPTVHELFFSVRLRQDIIKQ